MRKIINILLVILLVPVYLISFTVVHELGHTIFARLLGDPNSVFYLARIDGHNFCLGCNIYDPNKLSWEGNLIVSLWGLLATQLVALVALFLLHLRPANRLLQRILASIALGFAFLDVVVQVLQGLLYNINYQTWPTNVDLVDFMLLVQERTGAGQLFLKIVILLISGFYLALFVWFYNRNKVSRKVAL
jgi:hypothetical protein